MTPAGTAGLDAKRRALVRALLTRDGAAARPGSPVPRVADAPAYPLAPNQQRLWILHQLAPDSPRYNVAIPLPLRQRVHPAALERAVQELARRHEALRTTFPTVDGSPVQSIATDPRIVLERIDLTGLPATDRAAETTRAAQTVARRSFDLRTGPLLRAALLTVAADDHLLLLVLPHIVCDGWSVPILTRDLDPLYRAACTGIAPDIDQPAVRYRDAAVWLRRELDIRRGAETAYWRRQLADAPTLALATDEPRPAIPSFRGARLPVTLPAGTLQPLRALCRAEGVTTFMGLLAAYGLLLSEQTGASDLCIGVPISGRPTGTADVVGCFVNTIVLRIRLDAGESFRRLLHRVHAVAVEAYAHSSLPFDEVVEAVNPRRDPARNPLFQTMFQYYEIDAPGGEAAAGPAGDPVDRGAALFDISLHLSDSADGAAGVLEYATDLFRESTALTIRRRYQRLIDDVTRHPDRPVATDAAAAPGPLPAPLDPETTSDRPDDFVDRIADIWTTVLHLPDIRASDDFFIDLGGHSLLAIRVIALTRHTFDVDLPATTLFTAPTLARFADAVHASIVADVLAGPADRSNGRAATERPR